MVQHNIEKKHYVNYMISTNKIINCCRSLVVYRNTEQNIKCISCTRKIMNESVLFIHNLKPSLDYGVRENGWREKGLK